MRQRIGDAFKQPQLTAAETRSDGGITSDWRWNRRWRGNRGRHGGRRREFRSNWKRNGEQPDWLDSGSGHQHSGIDADSRNDATRERAAGNGFSNPGNGDSRSWYGWISTDADNA